MFRFAKQIGRVKQVKVKLNKNEEDRAVELHQKSIVIDLHLHAIVLPENLDHLFDYFRSMKLKIGYEGLKESGLTACFHSIGLSGLAPPRIAWQYEDVVAEIGMTFSNIVHHRETAIRAYNAEDIIRAKKEGKCAILCSVENAGIIHNKLDRLDVLYGLGVRSLGLTYNERNLIGDGASERTDSGLSDFGLKVIDRMNELGILIDLSHCGRTTAMEGINVSKDPVAFTHVGAYGLSDQAKCRKDDEMQTVAEKGGLIGIEAVPNVLSSKASQGIDDVMDHINYVINLVGVDHVCLGTDSLFGDHVEFHRRILKTLGLEKVLKGRIIAPYMEGIENPSELINITRGLVSRGYSDQEIRKIIGGNALRLIKKVIG